MSVCINAVSKKSIFNLSPALHSLSTVSTLSYTYGENSLLESSALIVANDTLKEVPEM